MKKLLTIACLSLLVACSKNEAESPKTDTNAIAQKSIKGTIWQMTERATQTTQTPYPASGKIFFYFNQYTSMSKVMYDDCCPSNTYEAHYEKRNDTLIISKPEGTEWYKIEEFTDDQLTLNQFGFDDYATKHSDHTLFDRFKFKKVK
jgi:hypothetical protein